MMHLLNCIAHTVWAGGFHLKPQALITDSLVKFISIKFFLLPPCHFLLNEIAKQTRHPNTHSQFCHISLIPSHLKHEIRLQGTLPAVKIKLITNSRKSVIISMVFKNGKQLKHCHLKTDDDVDHLA